MNVFYLPIALVYSALLLLEVRSAKKAMAMFAVVAGAAICGLRYYADVDYEPYIQLFGETPSITSMSFSVIQRLYGEPGYLLLTSAVKSLGLDFVAVTLLFSVLSLSIKYYVAAKLSRHYCLVVALYLCLHFVTVEFIELRWSIASSMVIFAIYMHWSGKTAVSVLLIVLASQFHYFSLLFFFIFAVNKFSLRVWYLIFFAVLMLQLLYKFVDFALFYEADSEIYLIRRLFRYINDPQSAVGAFSYLKIVMYIVSIVLAKRLLPGAEWDEKFEKITLSLLSMALFMSFVPLLYFRAMVVADFFVITLIVAMFSRLDSELRSVYLLFVSLMFCVWNYKDVSNYAAAGYISDYASWAEFVF